jgi:hypothetical protein
MLREPRFPLFIPSWSRATSARTMRALRLMGVPFRIIIEADQFDAYAAHHDPASLLVIPDRYFTEYDTFDDLGTTKRLGPGPARNVAWDTAVAEGFDWHWVMDDNIETFLRWNHNRRTQCGDGSYFAAMEEFVLRYTNVGMAGPQYMMFMPSKAAIRPPFSTGTRIYSCNLIRNALPYRWRGRYNEDTDLSLRMLKDGWATIQFNAFLQAKIRTQGVKGGNLAAFYAGEGTTPKSAMLVRMHPDVTTPVVRWGRAHHHVDYSRWRGQALIRDPAWTPTTYRDKLLPPARSSS